MRTGTHLAPRSPRLNDTGPIRLEDHCWVGAHARVAPGVNCHKGMVLTMGSVATTDLEEWAVHSGSPAQRVKARPRTAADSDD